MLAQAASRTATDASLAEPPVRPPGRYVAVDPKRWIGRPSVGTGECVPLVRQATGAPQSALWRPGALVQGNLAIRPGTAIATFDATGHYAGHAAIYLGQDKNGVMVIDQWNHRDGSGNVLEQHRPSARTLPLNSASPRPRVDRGESYRAIE